MDVFIARQPIYDKNLRVVAYELLYRSAEDMSGNGENSDFATASVIMEAFLNTGIENITGKKPGLINFTRNLLKVETISILPPEYTGIEILENILPSDEILSTCVRLKELGYTIVLDDYVLSDATKDFIAYADIIKMDFLTSSDTDLTEIISLYRSLGIKFVAEKIETREDYDKARAFGYDYFQGYFFQKPAVIQNKDLLPLQVNALKLTELLQSEETDIAEVADIVAADPGMAYKLLRLANSVMYRGARDVVSINSAILRIGLRELQTWVLYIMLYGADGEKPGELIRQSMRRAWAAEEICRLKSFSDYAGFSLMGLFSLMDVIMDTPLKAILSAINIAPEIKKGLLDPGDDPYGAVIRVIRHYDDAAFSEAAAAGALIGLTLEEYRDIYLSTLEKCDRVCQSLQIDI